MVLVGTGLDSVDNMIDVDAAGFQLINCEVFFANATYQADVVIQTDANADRLLVSGCYIHGATTAGTNSAISLVAAAATSLDDVVIEHSMITGDFTNAAIYGNYTGTALDINNCHILNYQNGDHAIELASTTAYGVIRNCTLGTNALSTALDPAYCSVLNTTWSPDSPTSDVHSVPVLVPGDQVSNLIGYNDSNNGADTSNVAANADGSVFERQEYAQSLAETSVETGAISLPASTQGACLTITGGPVLVLELAAIVTTQIQAQATNFNFVMNPTTGSDTSICAQLDLNGDVVGTLYTLPTSSSLSDAGALVATTNGCVQGMYNAWSFVAPAGTIDYSTAATSTGAINIRCRYVPLDPNAYMSGS
jgi:hypothetical protein